MKMFINKACRVDCLWWQRKISVAKDLIRQFKFTLEIFTDVSQTGWGPFCGG